MKWVIIAVIFVYRRFLRQFMRKRCMFAITCSEHVRQTALSSGAFCAIKCFYRRFRQCRPLLCHAQDTSSGRVIAFRTQDGAWHDAITASRDIKEIWGLCDAEPREFEVNSDEGEDDIRTHQSCTRPIFASTEVEWFKQIKCQLGQRTEPCPLQTPHFFLPDPEQ